MKLSYLLLVNYKVGSLLPRTHRLMKSRACSRTGHSLLSVTPPPPTHPPLPPSPDSSVHSPSSVGPSPARASGTRWRAAHCCTRHPSLAARRPMTTGTGAPRSSRGPPPKGAHQSGLHRCGQCWQCTGRPSRRRGGRSPICCTAAVHRTLLATTALLDPGREAEETTCRGGWGVGSDKGDRCEVVISY